MRPSPFVLALLGATLSLPLPLTATAAPPATKPAKPIRNVAIVVYEQAELLDFAGPSEVLAAAGSFAAGGGKSALNIYLVARTLEPITAQGFIKIVPQYSIDDAPAPDLVVIPGGNSGNLANDPAMMKWLTGATSASEATLTVCTGAMPLARAGAFDGMEITTWYGAIPALQAAAPKARVTNGRRFVDNGRYITTAGVSAGIDGALHLAARLFGRAVADQTARYMEYHWTPEPYLAASYPYWNPSTDERGRGLQAAALAAHEQRWPEAIAAYRALAAGDRDGLAWVGLGDALFHSGDRKGAIDAYGRVGAGSSAYAKALYNAACAHALLGNKAAALAQVQKALAAGMKREMALADADLASIREEIARLPAK